MSWVIINTPTMWLENWTYAEMSGELTAAKVRNIANARIESRAADLAQQNSTTATDGTDAQRQAREQFRKKEMEDRSKNEAEAAQLLTSTHTWWPDDMIPQPHWAVNMKAPEPWVVPPAVHSWWPLTPESTPKTQLPSAESIATLPSNQLERVFTAIMRELKPGEQFSFSNLTPDNFVALQAVYQRWNLKNNRSISGSQYAHGLANGILRSGELWNTSAIPTITNDSQAQQDFAQIILSAHNPEDFKLKMVERFAPKMRT